MSDVVASVKSLLSHTFLSSYNKVKCVFNVYVRHPQAERAQHSGGLGSGSGLEPVTYQPQALTTGTRICPYQPKSLVAKDTA